MPTTPQYGWGNMGPMRSSGGISNPFGGLFQHGDAKQMGMLQDYYNEVLRRQQAQMGPAQQAGYSGFRQNQTDLVHRLEAMASGQGPSLAAQQFQQATDKNLRQQNSLAAGGRGGPLARLTAANNTAGFGLDAAQGAALGRTNEQMGAIQQLGGVINQGRQSDEGVGMFNAQQGNQVGMANLDARLKQMGIDDATRLGILQQMYGQSQAPSMFDKLLSGFSEAAMIAATKGKGGK